MSVLVSPSSRGGAAGYEMLAPCGGDLAWHGCYSGNYDLLVPDAYCHPAKMGIGLYFRIMEHLEELGLLQQGDTVLDSMAGTGMTGLVAAVKGYPSVMVELEEKFVGYIKANKEALEKRLGRAVDMTIIQGDSRHLSDLLRERGLIGLVSPPYKTDIGGCGVQPLITGKGTTRGRGFTSRGNSHQEIYSDNPANIGNLPEGKPVVGITSPPYVNQELKVASNPHTSITQDKTSKGINYLISNLGYQSPGQIGRMHEGVIGLTSPPYEGGGHHRGMLDSWGGKNTPVSEENSGKHGYGNTKGQIEDAENYWDAMRMVYSESLKVCDVLAVVVKDPTRKGKLHPLGKLTWECLEACGWRIVDYHQAILFREDDKGELWKDGEAIYGYELIFQEGKGKVKKRVAGLPEDVDSLPNLIQVNVITSRGVVVVRKGRIGFFKRLALDKGNVAASYEHVLICVNPAGRRGMCQIISPPYSDMTKEGISLAQSDDGLAKRLRMERPNTYDTTGAGSARHGYGSSPGQIGNLKE